MVEKENDQEISFAELLESHADSPGKRVHPGERVSGRVAQIGKETVFIDLGGKSEGFADLGEFLDEAGNLKIKVGDWVEMRVASTKEGIHLTKGMKIQGADPFDMLREARENLLPIEGKVSGITKGGFEIDLSGIRAFCPLSQIDLIFTEKPEEHVGKRYSFRIMEIKEKGKNVIVSRRVLLEEEQERRARETLERLKPDVVWEGKISKLTNFGAFVDLGGVEGMVHISEIAHGRIQHPSEVLKTGQPVKVKVLKIETEKEGKPKISLSIKALEPDSWERGLGFEVGEIVRGKISRLTDFGLFVEVAPGVDGLVHISEISYDRISHPNQLFREGEGVEVLVLGIDPQTKRVSLSIKEATLKKKVMDDESLKTVRLEVGQMLKGIVEEVKPFGLFVRLPQFGAKVKGLLPHEELRASEKGDVKKRFPRGKEIQVEIISIDEKGKIRLSQRAMEEREDQEDYRKFMERDDRSSSLGTLGDVFKNLKLNKE